MEATNESLGTKLRETFESQDTIPRRMIRAAKRCRVPDRPGLSDELREKNAAQNAGVESFIARCEGMEADLRQAIELAGDGDNVGDVLVACEAVRTDEALLIQMLVQLCASKVALADAAVVELKAIPAQREKEAERVVERVKADLEKAGSGVAAQLAMTSGNVRIAERQFDNMARMVNTKSRAAIEQVKSAHEEVQAAYETAGAARRDLQEAKAELLKVARKALAG